MVRPLLLLGLFVLCLPSLRASADTDVLVVGDSHSVGTFKDGLLASLNQSDIHTSLYGSCGSSPQHWLGDATILGCPYSTSCGYYQRVSTSSAPGPSEVVSALKHATPNLAALVEKGKPGVVVIAMGTNQLGAPLSSAEGYVARTIAMAKKGGAKCVWVGPPRVGARATGAGNLDAFYAMLERVTRANRCFLIDSRPSTDAANVERKYWVHYEGKSGRKWGTAVGGRILQYIRENGPMTERDKAHTNADPAAEAH